MNAIRRPTKTANLTLASNEPNEGKKLIENLRRRSCVHCGSDDLKTFFALEQEVQPPFEYSHTVIAMCCDCRRGQLERTYFDSGDRDQIFDQTEWYLLDRDSMDQLREFILQSSTDNTLERKFSPCPEPLSPKCLCGVHWQLTEAARRLEPLTDNEMQDLRGVVSATFSCTGDNVPRFERSH